ncbi:hypothetical protein ARAF_0089 [Arsenophonus endosymbiont of Aleurodicus floccissimus]|uniref:hypothetical protein n=1 Tax=Arsenophonus endosymbiont of Aleurodicus floccissimus TaxID=2152761 RepID=UPI000EEA5FF6|nr:hypothetical protein [Arsenophonus endosymbiont of Aleurodicus floccissimus]SPP30987.1 hypothetical protein ARAF_0089 [Arsenophonus endosymbiont of Aleurodicus floccissimus]
MEALAFFAGNGTNRTPKWHPISHRGKVIYVSDQEVTYNDVLDLITRINNKKNKLTGNPRNITVISATHGTELGDNFAVSGFRRKDLIHRDFYREDRRLKKNF